MVIVLSALSVWSVDRRRLCWYVSMDGFACVENRALGLTDEVAMFVAAALAIVDPYKYSDKTPRLFRQVLSMKWAFNIKYIVMIKKTLQITYHMMDQPLQRIAPLPCNHFEAFQFRCSVHRVHHRVVGLELPAIHVAFVPNASDPFLARAPIFVYTIFDGVLFQLQ